MAPPTDDVAAEVAALRFWDGRGTVELVDADVPHGASLLGRLDSRRALSRRPAAETFPVLAELIPRLARPTPAGVRPHRRSAPVRACLIGILGSGVPLPN